ncbi:galactose-1-phosphate uridylyltransferase [bacterium]|nr:galactose-1-phosphate uridylyltransferase [bacterium]
MAEFRHDPVHKRWVIVAVDRSRNPDDFDVPRRTPDGGFCPLCEGQESKTPGEIFAVRSGNPNRPGWKIRVIPNKYPVLADSPEGIKRNAVGHYDFIAGAGAHEIIVEHPSHQALFHDLGSEHLTELITTYRQRAATLMENETYRYIMLFKNHGQAAGATTNHPHSQVLAMPVIPRIVAMALATAREHFHLKERCLFCDLLNQEIEDGSRVVAENEHFICYVPYASRFPFEMAVFPKKHHHDFSSMDDALLAPCAEILQQAVGRLFALFGDPPFNMLVHSGPNTNQTPRRAGYWGTLRYDWHWHIEITPRLSPIAGFELGTGMYINHTPPERAAELLRQTQPPAPSGQTGFHRY